MLKHLCPCCGRHCNLKNLHCERGKEYERTGIVPPHTHINDEKKSSEHKKRYHILDQNNKLIWNLRDMGHTIRGLSEGKGSQSRILIILNEVETITQRELTERLGVQPGSASEVIGKLESAGLIIRTPSAKDHRTADIQLTEIGKIKAKEATEQRKKRHCEMFACLSEEDKQDLLMLLEKVNYDWRYRYSGNSVGRGQQHKRKNYQDNDNSAK